ncbi:MAG: two-component regulator propeller domain-containing protein, partial [Chitinophagales bacterium]
MNRYSRSVFFLFSLILITIANSFAQNPEWINYTNGNYVTSIAAQDSSVWVATYGGGLVKINKNTGETSFFNHANSGLPYNAVFSLALDHQGDLWMGNTDGDYSYLVRFDGTQFTSYNLVCVLSIAVDSNDNKWFGCIDLQKFDGTTWTNFSPSGFINIDNLAITSDQHIWGLYRGGNSILDFGYTGDSMTSYNFLNSNIPYGNYSGLAIDSNDTLWFCSTDHVTEETELVSFFNGAMVQVIPFPSSVTGTINQLFIDKNDSKWIASQHGLLEFSNGNWIVYDISNSAISSNAVLAVSTINDNDIWIGTDAGLDRLNNNIWTHHITSNSGLNSRYVLNVKASTLKSIWMDNESSLISFDGEIWSHFNPNNSNGQGPAFNLFDIGDEDNLWLYDISNYGLDQFSIQSNAWSFYDQSNSDIPSNETISALYANNGNGVWMQFVSGVPGLVEYDGTTWKIFNTTNSSIPSDDSRLIGVDEENNVWLAEPYNNAEHENKITKFNGSQFDTYVFGDTSLHFDFGLSHMARDQQGNWWFTSIPGIFKFDGTEFILNPNGFSA